MFFDFEENTLVNTRELVTDDYAQAKYRVETTDDLVLFDLLIS